MDTEYLKQNLGDCLADCLAEVCEKRPHDPIEYMGQLLYKYLENVSYQKQKEAEVKQLKREEIEHELELTRQEERKKEADMFRKEEEERLKKMKPGPTPEITEKQAKDLSQLPGAPNLPTVVEGDEPPEAAKDPAAAEEKVDSHQPETIPEEKASELEAETLVDSGGGGDTTIEGQGQGEPPAVDTTPAEAPAGDAAPAEDKPAEEEVPET